MRSACQLNQRYQKGGNTACAMLEGHHGRYLDHIDSSRYCIAYECSNGQHYSNRHNIDDSMTIKDQGKSAKKGKGRCQVTKSGCARFAKEVLLTDDTMLVLPVEPGRTLRGTVLGRDGQPLEGIAVRVEAAGRGFEVMTNREGRFLLTDLTPGEVEVRVHDSRARPSRSGEEHLFSLHEGGEFLGRILDGAGNPVRFFQSAVILPGENVNQAKVAWHRADAEGRFRLALPAKPAYVLFRKPGHDDLLGR